MAEPTPARDAPMPGPGGDAVPPARPEDEWPAAAAESAEALDRPAPGFPGLGGTPPPPPAPVAPGRGGAQRIPRPYSARPGAPAPWAHLSPLHRRPTVADVRAAFVGLGPARPSPGVLRDGPPRPGRPSAVLAPLYDAPVPGAADGGSEAWVVLTRRTWTLRSHQGEVSFPGGRVEPGESPLDAARREAFEEIALDPAAVEVVGQLDHLATVSSGSDIVPFVGLVPGRPPTRPNPAEVAAVLHVPLSELLDPTVFREERWTFPDGREQPIMFFELVGDTVWGATAALLRQLLGLVTGTLGRGDLGHP
ncbi:MAG TPA: NUDIX domain-containing protein [Acidimicrobiales bacterium]|nr:NUDIX domain-containing protein [Acidimicrobiales bacterium]